MRAYLRKYSNTTNFSYSSYVIQISVTKTWQKNGHSTCYYDVLTEKTFQFIPRKKIPHWVYPATQSCTQLSAVIYATAKLIARVVPRKGPAWKRNIPPRSMQLQTAGPTARDYADCRRSICHGSLLSLEQQPSPPALHDMIQTHKQVVAAPLHFFIQNISWRSYQWAHLKWNAMFQIKNKYTQEQVTWYSFREDAVLA